MRVLPRRPHPTAPTSRSSVAQSFQGFQGENMRWIGIWSAAFVLALGVGTGSLWGGTAGDDSRPDVARLIRQLGDDEFLKREAASQELASIGEPAYDALRRAAATSEDVEIRRRPQALR